MRFSCRLLLIPLASFVLAACDASIAPGGEARETPAVPVITAEAEMTRITDRIEAVGTTRANESVDITARVSNIVTRVNFREGSLVEQGQLLLELEASEARAALAVAEAELLDIRSQVERSRQLVAQNAIAESQLEQMEAQFSAARARVESAQAVLRDHAIRAPFSGRVGLRRVSPGTLVTPGTRITTLDRVDVMQLDFQVPETYLSSLQEGLPLTAHSVAWPDADFEGTVATIDARVDPVTRTVTVRADVPNENNRLRPGMFMTVMLEKNPREAITVPEQAIVSEGQKKFVFIIDEDQAVMREVRLGTRLYGSVEIIDGLETGEEYVTEGTQSLRQGTTIRRVEE